MTVRDLAIESKLYYGKTYAKTVRGSFYDSPANRSLAYRTLAAGARSSTVIIPETVRTSVHVRVATPHRDCEAGHLPSELVWYTTISARAFDEVSPEHRAVVLSLGATLSVIRVPVIRKLTMEDFSGNIQ